VGIVEILWIMSIRSDSLSRTHYFCVFSPTPFEIATVRSSAGNSPGHFGPHRFSDFLQETRFDKDRHSKKTQAICEFQFVIFETESPLMARRRRCGVAN
jgi:hypothetical protein